MNLKNLKMSITLTHKICLEPTIKQEQYFRKASGTARFTWNWALNEWLNQYKSGLKPTAFKLKKNSTGYEYLCQNIINKIHLIRCSPKSKR